jgi:ABC-type Mn2+/Zn2+ transport system ATPase subunit
VSAAPPLVALRGASVGYGRRALLAGVSVEIGAGDFLAIVGPNGGGKTTLLRTLLGVLPPLAGERVLPSPLAVGYVPQRDQVDAVWPLTAGEVAAMGRARLLPPGRRPGPADHAAVLQALARVGIGGLEDRPFRDLSGGQRQRTLIARALAAEPRLLALDEPTSGMDPAGELDVMELLDRLNREAGLAVVMVSHRLDAVANHATQLVFVDHHRQLLRVGTVAGMLTGEALSALYGREVRVRREDGRVAVLPAGGGGP